MEELKKQNVTTESIYGNVLNKKDIRRTNGDNTNDGSKELSSFNLLKKLLYDWWKSSNTAEYHLQSVHRKVIHMLSKSIWTLKIIRVLFQLMGNNLASIDQKEGDRSLTNEFVINMEFQRSMGKSIHNYLLTECEKVENAKWILWSNHNDVIAGYNWFLRKMLAVDTLLSLKFLPDVVAERTGKTETYK